MTEYLSTPETSKMMRKKLKAEFPGIKFSVRSDKTAVNVSWTDGPTTKMVDAVVGPYAGGGFDGMIDMAYNSTSYLLADGFTMVDGNCGGTENSMGCAPAYKNEIPEGAVEVSPGPNYVFTKREFSVDFLRRGIEAVERKWGGFDANDIEIDGPTEWGGARINGDPRLENAGEYLNTMVYRAMANRVPASYVAKAKPAGKPVAIATDRPGDMAAVMADETGIDYSRCLVMCNMD